MVVQLGDFSSQVACLEVLDQFTNEYVQCRRISLGLPSLKINPANNR